MDAMITCEACGATAEAKGDWFTVHFSARNAELVAAATDANLRYLGEHSACSKDCLIELVRRWAETWKREKHKAAAN